MSISIKELLKISGGWMEDKKSKSTYLNDFKKNQAENLLEYIE